MARRRLQGDRLARSIQPTELVHEVFLRLHRSGVDLPTDHSHYLALASTMMRHLLVDYARARMSAKRGGDRIQVDLELLATPEAKGIVDLLALDDALSRLQAFDKRAARIVEMKFYGDMTEDQIAAELGLSSRWVRSQWAYARAWLYRELYK